VAPPVFKTGLAGLVFAGGFDSLPPPPKGHVIGTRPETSEGMGEPVIRFDVSYGCGSRYLADCLARGLRLETMRKYQLLARELVASFGN
jgi:hypothetical protein